MLKVHWPRANPVQVEIIPLHKVLLAFLINVHVEVFLCQCQIAAQFVISGISFILHV